LGTLTILKIIAVSQAFRLVDFTYVVNDIFFYLLLGLIQGTVEWLPISSEGMLTLVQTSSGINYNTAIAIALWIHLGTLAAVLFVFKEEWKRFFLTWDEPVPERKFIIITTIGTGLLGIPVKLFIVDLIGNTNLFVGWVYLQIGLALIITGILLKMGQLQTGVEKTIENLSWKQQLIAGLAQGFTIIPGISRSGTTVSALLFMRVEGEESFRASFLMSVPAVLGATILEVLDVILGGGSLTSEVNFGLLALAIITAFITGLLTIRILLRIAKDLNFALIALFFGLLLLILGLIQLL